MSQHDYDSSFDWKDIPESGDEPEGAAPDLDFSYGSFSKSASSPSDAGAAGESPKASSRDSIDELRRKLQFMLRPRYIASNVQEPSYVNIAEQQPSYVQPDTTVPTQQASTAAYVGLPAAGAHGALNSFGSLTSLNPFVAGQESQETAGVTDATLAQRAVAFLIDSVLVWTLHMIVLTTLFASVFSDALLESMFDGFMIWTIIYIIVLWIYKAGQEGVYGRTLGKRFLGLKVITADGKPMTMQHAVKRNVNIWYPLIPIVGTLALYFSYIARFFSVMNSPANQGYHDRWAKTRLVRNT